jgi:hypothetical protein
MQSLWPQDVLEVSEENLNRQTHSPVHKELGKAEASEEMERSDFFCLLAYGSTRRRRKGWEDRPVDGFEHK